MNKTCACYYNEMCVKTGEQCMPDDLRCPLKTMSNQEYYAMQHARGTYCPYCNGQLGGFITKKCKSCGKIIEW